VLDACILASAAGWFWLLRHGRAQGVAVPVGLRAMGFGAMALCIVMLVVPYRIIWHNEAQRVTYASETCYLVAQQTDKLLLYCPGVPTPRNRVVGRSDPAVGVSSVVESLFTSSPPGAQQGKQ
jgi:hypothetical protein